MAEHGADVLAVTAPQLPQVTPFVRDTGLGRRSTYLGYTRPDRLAEARPGVIYVSVNCFGSGGPFADRAGWDQVPQAVSGICDIQGHGTRADGPAPTPVHPLDFLTGLLGGFGAMVALARRAREGGSYHVEVSLRQSAMLIQRQGLLDDFADAPNRLRPAEFEQPNGCHASAPSTNVRRMNGRRMPCR